MSKELLELRRDRRILGILALVGSLVLLALIAASSAQTKHAVDMQAAERADRDAFQRQGDKAPHAAAHFGRMAYKPASPLSIFDAGSAPYLGQVIWLEAHRRDPAMFRPAEDAPALSRLADLSVAGTLTLVVPLLAFAIGHGSIVRERERGTLTLIASNTPQLWAVLAGKLAAIATITVGVTVAAVTVSLALAAVSHADHRVADVLLRGGALLVSFGLYAVLCAMLAIAVSARARSSSSALAILMSLWVLSVILTPRVAASVAERIHPTPESSAFWAQTDQRLAARRLRRSSAEYRALEQQVVSRALARSVDPTDPARPPLSREGLGLEISETRDAETFAAAYRNLFASYARQRSVRRLFAFISPTIALQHVSSALAGTDVATHESFAAQAETQRLEIIRRLNEDMMLHGAGRGYDYLAGAALWGSIPQFEYTPPGVAFAIRSAGPELLILLLWIAVAAHLAARAAAPRRLI